MKLQQYLLNSYLHVDFESFSHRAVLALGLLRSIEHNPINEMSADSKVSLGDAIKEVKSIIDDTDKDTCVNIFVLDKNIIPQDMSKNSTNYQTKFSRNRTVKGEKTVTLSQDQIQSKLCYASMRIHEILMEQIAGYSDQFFMDGGEL